MREISQKIDGVSFQKPGLIPPRDNNSLEGIKVLVADDDFFVSDLISRVIKQHLGAEVVTVDCGSKAIAETLSGEYDVAIIDLILPKTSGMEAIKVIKEMIPDFPIIAMTGESSPGRDEFVKACGVDSLFFKPIRISMLLDELMSVVKTGREWPAVK